MRLWLFLHAPRKCPAGVVFHTPINRRTACAHTRTLTWHPMHAACCTPQVEEVARIAMSLEPLFDPRRYNQNMDMMHPRSLFERIGGNAAVEAAVGVRGWRVRP